MPFSSDGIFLCANLNAIYWNVPILKNKEKLCLYLVYCMTYEGKHELLRTYEKLVTSESTSPIYHNPAYNLKAVFPENFHITAAHIWQFGTLALCKRTRWHPAHFGLWQRPLHCQGGRSPCQIMRATKQPADGTNPSPVASAGPQSVTAPPWAPGRSLFPEPVLVFRVWVPTNAWYFTATSSQRG